MEKKNKIGRLNRWLTLGANIGVVLGLIILIVEVRQNANLTRANMEISKNSLLAEIELNIAKPEIAKVWIKSIRNPENLTDSEMRTVEALLVSLMLQWDMRFKMEDAGLASRGEARQHILNTAKFYFGGQFTKHWWSLQSSGWDGTPMMEVAGPIVDGVDENFLTGYMDNLRTQPKNKKPEVRLRASTNADKKALIALDDAWVAAEIAGDRQVLARIFDEDFISTFKSGKTVNRDAYIDYIVNAKIDPFSVVHDTIKIHGDTAIVIDLSTSGKTKFTWIAVKRGDAWRVVSQTFSEVKVKQ